MSKKNKAAAAPATAASPSEQPAAATPTPPAVVHQVHIGGVFGPMVFNVPSELAATPELAMKKVADDFAKSLSVG